MRSRWRRGLRRLVITDENVRRYQKPLSSSTNATFQRKSKLISTMCNQHWSRRSTLFDLVGANGALRLNFDKFELLINYRAKQPGVEVELRQIWSGFGLLINYRTSKWSSKLANKGDLMVTTVNLNAEIYRKYIIDELLPDIKANCPPEMLCVTIVVQHDNAPAYSLDN